MHLVGLKLTTRIPTAILLLTTAHEYLDSDTFFGTENLIEYVSQHCWIMYSTTWHSRELFGPLRLLSILDT
jgi:hypothetical protein